ncbi:MAG: hypothetical protein Q9187_006302 [Circinaria calcarea]
MRLAYSGSFFKLRFRFLASHSGNGRAVEDPEIVYTGTVEWFDSFISVVGHQLTFLWLTSKQDGVLFVQWTVYVLEEDSHEAAGRDGLTPENAKFERQLDFLQCAEAELRKEGCHVSLDRRTKTLWVFDLSGPSVKQETRGEERKEPALLLGNYGCKKLTFGSLRASDLADQPVHDAMELGGKGKTSSKKFEGTNLQTFQANAFLEMTLPLSASQAPRGSPAGTPTFSQDNAAIYHKIISAISMSICYALASNSECVPFGPCRFLKPGPTSGDYEVCETNCNTQAVKPLNAVSLNVNWLSSGTLVISSFPELGISWFNVANPHSSMYQDLDTTGVKILVLAPLGICALYKACESTTPTLSSVYNEKGSSSGNGDSEKTEDIIYLERKSWKCSVAALLDCYGLEITRHTQWTWVLTSGSIPDNQRPNPLDSLTQTILWPSHLCFYRALGPISDICDYSWAWERSGFNVVDPLADAESWFLGRNSRKELLEARKCQTDLETRTRANSPSSDGDDSLSELFIGIRRSIDQHALSGIYPTPPDASRSQAINAIAAQDLDAIETADRRIPVDHLEERQQERRDHNELPYTSPDADMGLGEYDQLEGDDLFGDMNSDMFTANGITEADFNFFDEPAHAYEAIPDAVLVNEDSSSYATYASSNPKSKQPSNEKREISTKEVLAVRASSHNGTANKATVTTVTIETSLDHTTSSSLQSSKSLRKRAETEEQSVKGEKRDSSSGIDITRADQYQVGWRDTSYRGIPFTELKPAFDKKYSAQGRFDTAMPSQLNGCEPKKRSSNEMGIPRLGFVAGDEDPSDTEEGEDPSDEMPLYLLLGEDDEQSVKDIMQHVNNDSNNTYRKRKRESIESDNTTCITSDIQTQQDQPSDVEQFPSLNSLLSSIDNDHQLSLHYIDHLTPSRQVTKLYSGNDQSFIQLAQIVAGQLTGLPELQCAPLEKSIEGLVKFTEDPLHRILPRLFPRSEQCNLQAYLSIDECPLGLAQVSRPATKPIHRKHDVIKGSQDPETSTQDVFLIPPLNILVQRGNILMEISPTALPFWEQLGLEPSAGVKDIRAMCIYPESQMMQRSVGAFLETIGSTYQSMRLGNHTRRSLTDFADGFVPVRLDGSTIEGTAGSLQKICERLGELLRCELDADQPTIIYMVNPFDELKALPHLCSSFSKILEANGYGSGSCSYSTDLVLKILPISLLASRTTIALPPPQLYARLAMEVYNQSPHQSPRDPSSPINSHSLFQLAECIPKTISFSLTSDPSAALIREDAAYHLAYSWSSDGQWLSMALTNTCGSKHCSVSYCLGMIPAKWPTFRAVAKEVWDTTLELLNTNWTAHQLFIVKDSLMAQVEIDTWAALAAQTEPNPVRIVLVTVDPSPSLYCVGGKGRNISPLDESDCYATPAATPLASIHALDLSSPITNSGWAHHPRTSDGPDTDPKARLIDKTDETWGAVATRSYEREGAPAALASGFLIKRAGPVDDDGVMIMGVSIVYAETMNDSLLKKILCMYRALGILAKARGATTGLNLLPWHIAVARTARQGLNSTMQWAET